MNTKDILIDVDFIARADEEAILDNIDTINEMNDKDIFEALIENKAYYFQLIENQTEELQEIAINKDSSLIRYMTDASDYIKQLALDDDYENIMYMQDASDEIKKYALDQSYDAIQYIDNPSDDLKRYAEFSRKELGGEFGVDALKVMHGFTDQEKED